MNNDFKYSAYCTVFWYKENDIYYVETYNELTDRTMKKYKCKTREEAEALAKRYVAHAPNNVICQNLNDH